MFPQGAHTPSSRGNLYARDSFHMHTDLLRIVPRAARRAFYAKKKPIPRCAERAFSVSLLSSRWSGLTAKLSLEANESAKSPSPSLAGQSVIVNQAGLLAPVHRSFASSRGAFPSDCRLALACEFAHCYSGVTAPAYEIISPYRIPYEALRLCTAKPLHLIQFLYVIFMVR